MNKKMSKSIQIILFVFSAIIFVACTPTNIHSGSNNEKRFSTSGVHYSLPEAWKSSSDGHGGNIHYPTDGGALYVMSTNWAPVDLTKQDKATEILELSAERAIDYMGITHIDEMDYHYLKNKYSIHFNFLVGINDGLATGNAVLFVKNSEVYQIIFVYPWDLTLEESSLYQQHDTIINSITT